MAIEQAALHHRAIDGICVVEMSGAWELTNRERLAQTFAGISDGCEVLLDMRGATYCDSTILTEIIKLHKRLSFAGRRLEVAVEGSKVRRLFQITHLDKLLKVSPERLALLER